MKYNRQREFLLFGCIMCVFALILIHMADDGAHGVNAKLKEYCARVAIYEQTKHTNDVRGHRDFDDDMECKNNE